MTVMRRIQVFFLCIMAACILPTAAMAQVTARIDRNSMALDETLTLTLTKDGSSFFSGPDLQPLEKDFKVLGQSKSSTTKIINGSTSSTAEWNIVLSPSRTGTLEIPPLTVGKEKSNPLTVQVSDASPPKTKADNVPIFIETDVNTDSVYVQAQLIFTLRLYSAVEARINEPPDPKLENALVRRLDDTTYDKTVDGQSYKVFERKYAIFPQHSGTLKIPQQVVEITVPSRQQTHSFFDPFGALSDAGEQIKLRSETKTIHVMEKPPEFPASDVWLPASTVLLKEQWSTSAKQLKVGESTTVAITVTADGLTGEQLPPLTLPETDGLKLYQGKAEVDSNASANGIVGTRKESIAIIPTKAGTYELPEIRIPWWNKEQKKVEYAVIPARKFSVQGTVAANAKQEQNSTSAKPPPQKVAEPAAPRPLPGSPPTIWMLLSAVLGAGWLLTLYFLVRMSRRVGKLDGKTGQKFQDDTGIEEKKAFAAVIRSCRENNPADARKEVFSWLRAFLPGSEIHTFSDAEKVLQAPDFFDQLHELDRTLFDPVDPARSWQGNGLLEQVEKIRAGRTKTAKKTNQLAELYK